MGQDSQETLVRELSARKVKADLVHTGGGAMVVQVPVSDGSAIWVTDEAEDGFLAGHYEDPEAEETPARGWVPGLEGDAPEPDPRNAADSVIRYLRDVAR